MQETEGGERSRTPEDIVNGGGKGVNGRNHGKDKTKGRKWENRNGNKTKRTEWGKRTSKKKPVSSEGKVGGGKGPPTTTKQGKKGGKITVRGGWAKVLIPKRLRGKKNRNQKGPKQKKKKKGGSGKQNVGERPAKQKSGRGSLKSST